jgi:hypothetical protein
MKEAFVSPLALEVSVSFLWRFYERLSHIVG